MGATGTARQRRCFNGRTCPRALAGRPGSRCLVPVEHEADCGGDGHAGGIQDHGVRPRVPAGQRPVRHRGRRAPGYHAKDFQCVLEIPFSINCLWRRPARSSGLAVRNTLSRASGKTTVPMSRPSATRPGWRRNARCRSSRAARTAPWTATCDAAALTSSPRIRSVTSRPSSRIRPSANATSRSPAAAASAAAASKRDSRFDRLQRHQPVERSAVEQVEAERPRDPGGDRPLAGRGGAVDGDHRHVGRHRISTFASAAK